jgi:hypothetical protein
MAGWQVFNQRKALEVLLYVSRRCQNTYHALKVLFYADKKHLTKYGRLITGDRYVAMSKGPVPSGAYDIVKMARGDSSYPPDGLILSSLSVRGFRLTPMREPDLDFLSLSERECLDEAIKEIKPLPYAKLLEMSHEEPAYKAADPNDTIPLEILVRSLPDGDSIWRYLVDC